MPTSSTSSCSAGGSSPRPTGRASTPIPPGSRAATSAPTLLIVGGADTTVLALNEQAAAQLRCPHKLEVVPGATHLFEEPGALERVAELAGDWFAGLLPVDQ